MIHTGKKYAIARYRRIDVIEGKAEEKNLKRIGKEDFIVINKSDVNGKEKSKRK